LIPFTNKHIIPLGNLHQTEVDLLRLDIIHPTISGNKWYKLQPYLTALPAGSTLITLGGAYSNHLHACAFACHELGISCIGIVRGEEVENPTLMDCKNWGMQLIFIRRNIFDAMHSDNVAEIINYQLPFLFVPVGGFGPQAIAGASEILSNINIEKYTHIAVSIGSGTTAIGISKSILSYQELIGITSIKDAPLKELLSSEITCNFHLIQTQELGGYGQVNKPITDYMIRFYETYDVLLDYTYTTKMMMILEDRIQYGSFNPEDKILAIHTGGIQGNRGNQALMQRLADLNKI
jgi:1-aminocyclopropane-1-carboxylate deaminase